MTWASESDADDLIATALRLPLVVVARAPRPALQSVLRLIETTSETGWDRGDDSPHSWAEHALDEDAIAAVSAAIPLLAALAERSTSVVSWINRFRQGQWIGAHRDASGDLQCILPLRAPDCEDGGQLWIGMRARSVSVFPGDMLLFDAAACVHGTNAITAQGAERVTLNLRYWLR